MNIKPEDILESVNKVRENPSLALNEIKDQLKKFQSNSVYRNKKDLKVRTLSGKVGWQDAVLALERQKAKGPLAWNSLLSRAVEEYKSISLEGNDVNPFEVIKSFCSYEGNISFNINESDVQQDLIELMAAMIVGDGDEKKGSRKAIFHPLYREFACAVRKTGNKNIIYCAFAQSVQENTEKSPQKKGEKSEMRESRSSAGWSEMPIKPENQLNSPTKYKSAEKEPQTKQDYLRKGKQLIGLLNKVRKQPKQYVHAIKAEIEKFKDEKTIATDYGTILTKEGQIPYYELISEVESQYPLPTMRQVTGLSLVAMEQVIEDQSMIEYKVSVQALLDKFCASSEGIRSLKLRDINRMPTEALLLRLLLGDGDRKRTARKKLLSPICKAIGCCIGKNIIVVNVGESAKDNPKFVEEYMANILEPVDLGRNTPKNWNKLDKNEEVPHFYQPEENRNYGHSEERVVVKRTMKSHYEKRGGRSYKVTEISIIYDDGKCEEIVEEDLIH